MCVSINYLNAVHHALYQNLPISKRLDFDLKIRSNQLNLDLSIFTKIRIDKDSWLLCSGNSVSFFNLLLWNLFQRPKNEILSPFRYNNLINLNPTLILENFKFSPFQIKCMIVSRICLLVFSFWIQFRLSITSFPRPICFFVSVLR